jgi:hypothetical protein
MMFTEYEQIQLKNVKTYLEQAHIHQKYNWNKTSCLFAH